MSQQIDDGGSAFPCEALADYRDTEATKFRGMSLRAWLAGMALEKASRGSDRSADEIARRACYIADAVIAELNRRD